METKKNSKEKVVKVLKVLLPIALIVFAGCALLPESSGYNPIAIYNSKFGMKFIKYEDAVFFMRYPDWASLPESQSKPQNMLVATGDRNCRFVLLKSDVPTDKSYGEYIVSELEKQIKSYNGEVSNKEIGEKTAMIEGTTKVGTNELKSHSRGYLASDGKSYSFAFVSPKNDFEIDCRPFIDRTVKSVVVK